MGSTPAANSPASVPDVESNFSREATNSLTQAHLLVRSGMNYVVYWAGTFSETILLTGECKVLPRISASHCSSASFCDSE
jgi:hypothetical protein